MATILHDIGKVVFIRNTPDLYKEICNRQKETKEPLFKLEKDFLDTTHAEIGGYLMGLWGLPENIVKAITYHHTPLSFPHAIFNTITAVYISNIILHQATPTAANFENIEINRVYAEKLKILPNIKEWTTLCETMIKQQDGKDEFN